jgi:transcriptional activator HAC1
MENSPADSLLSAPDGDLPSLFASTSDSTMNPRDIMTPPPGSEDHATPSGLSTVPEDDDCAEDDSDKKPTKKRKSWGQVLPEPKTNLPPRKRAKTEDEKEQRRVERVLRNRRAAQSSRERKRLEVEALEKRNQELEDLLATAQKTNFALLEELKRHRQGSGVISTAGSPLDHTLSSQLFGAEPGQTLDPESLDKLVATPPTVNPASLSPPPDEPQNQEPETAEIIPAPKSSESAQAAASDMTQRPAVSVGTGEPAAPVADFGLDDLSRGFALDFAPVNVPEATDTDRFVLESGLLDSPQSSYLDDDHLAGNQPDGLFSNHFDINEWLNEPNNLSDFIPAHQSDATVDFLGLEPQGFDLESQAPTQDPFQQPESGASSSGCDVRGIAVGV